jgi:hypothetical protein
MFRLDKDIEKYEGIPPYASELYGVYQPLLGWKSNLTKKWIQRDGRLLDPRTQGILDAYIKPGPATIGPLGGGTFDGPAEFDEIFALPLEPGTNIGTNPYSVMLTIDLNSEFLNIIRDRVQVFVGMNEGQLPEGSQWASIVDINEMMGESEDNILHQVNIIHRNRLIERMGHRDRNWHGNAALIAESKAELMKLMQYESQIAAFFFFHAGGHLSDYDSNELKKLFYVQKAPPLSEILRSPDPLARINPKDKSGILSPVGFVHLFRQYFFNLGTFLGEPVEHVWLAPGTTIELIEISTRKQIVERTLEQMLETTMRSERATTLSEELSDATRQENENSTKLGVSTSHTADLFVYQGTVSAEFGIESTRSTSRETAYKQNREQSENLSNEIKQSVKSVFRTVTETTDTTSRRHIIANPSKKLINYELRRKMRRVGVQVQGIGTRLCWQVFIDEPGKELGLSNLVHIAKPADLQSQPNGKETDYPPRLVKGFEIDVVWAATENPRNPDSDGYVIFTTFQLPVQPDTGYELEVPQNGFVPLYIKSIGGRDVDESPFAKAGGLIALTGRLVVGTNQINVGVESRGLIWNRNVTFSVTAEVAFVPTAEVKKEIDDGNKKIREDGQAAKREEQRLAKEAFYKAAKERIELASNIKSRPSWDLREEERTIVYRELIERLMLDSWEREQKGRKGEDPDQYEEHRRLSHVRSEIIRTLFDVDSMLYFVAPEWWLPRKHYSQFIGRPTPTGIKSIGRRSQGALGNEVVVNWSDNEARPDNYYITDKSQPAKLGSSLGWLLQLDGDNLRNAFLNAPWVKAVIPIRPGREKAALNWLRTVAEGEDGWNADYLGTEPEFAGKKMGEVLEIITDRLEKENGDIQNVLEADEVFETGFSHLKDAFDASVDPNKPFTQWISVLPTDQIVAVEYEPTNLLTDLADEPDN